MALRDKLRQLRQQTDVQPTLDKKAVLDEWLQSIEELWGLMRAFLAPYEKEGDLSIQERRIIVREADLGSYRTQALVVLAGPARIDIKPIGRIVAGAVGRVELSRQGRASRQRLVLLRLDRDGRRTWVFHNAASALFLSGALPNEVDGLWLVTLQQNTFEAALEFLLA